MSVTCHRRPKSALLVAAVVAAATLLFTACGSSGRTLRDPKEGATAPARKNSGATSTTGRNGASTSAGAAISATSLSLTTSAWSTGANIPKAYTCDGANTSPPLAIAGAPAKAVELVLVVTNQNRSTETLWMLAGLAPGTAAIPQGGVPSGAIEIVNSSGTARWSGPCPTPGPNTYEFALYALDRASGLTASSTRAQVEAVIANSSAASIITGTYKR